jgi:hypothetical protein
MMHSNRKSRTAFAGFVLIAAPLLHAQGLSVSGPRSGLVYDAASQTVRPILGVPGAAYLGTPLLSSVDFASISPSSGWVFTLSGGEAGFARINDRTVERSAPAGLLPHVDRVAWSPDSLTAVLASSERGALQRVHLADSAPAVDPIQDVSALGPITALAVDSRAHVAVAVSGASSGLYRLPVSGEPALLTSVLKPADAKFNADGSALYVLDDVSRRIAVLPGSLEGGDFQVLPSADVDGFSLSADATQLYLAKHGEAFVQVYDTSSQAVIAELPVDFQPAAIEPISKSTFLLREQRNAAGSALHVLDARQKPAIYFVPSGKEDLQ